MMLFLPTLLRSTDVAYSSTVYSMSSSLSPNVSMSAPKLLKVWALDLDLDNKSRIGSGHIESSSSPLNHMI
jgi:hypothetical protein